MTIAIDFIHSFRFVLQREGWRSAMGLVALIFFEFHRACVLRRSLKGVLPVREPDVDVTIRLATPDDLDLLRELVPPLRIKRFARKLEAGEMCMLALADGKCVAFTWTGFAGGLSAEQTPLKLAPREAYYWGAYCSPPYRRRGITTAVGLQLARWLQENDYESVLILTDRDNRAVLKIAQNTDVEIVAHFTSLRILKWRFFRYTAIDRPSGQTSSAAR